MSDEPTTSSNYYLCDRFFKERIEFEDQFFDYLFKSAKTRNSRHKSMAEFKQKAAELKGDLKMENADSANKLENIAKWKSKAEKLERRIAFSDGLVQDYADDFESRRESRDQSDYDQLVKNKRMYLSDIYITKMGMQTQEKELQALTESLAEYYHYYDQPARLPRNMDVDDMLGRKKMLAKEIHHKTNCIQDWETKLEAIEVKLNFIVDRERQECDAGESPVAYFKVIQANSALAKTIRDLQNVIDKLKPKITEIDQQLSKLDSQFCPTGNGSGGGVIQTDLPAMFDTLQKESNRIKEIVNDNSIVFYNCRSYSRKWTLPNLKKCILEVQETMEEYRKTGHMPVHPLGLKGRSSRASSMQEEGCESNGKTANNQKIDSKTKDNGACPSGSPKIRSKIGSISDVQAGSETNSKKRKLVQDEEEEGALSS